MLKKEFNGRLYNHAPPHGTCPLITIDGKPYCVMKDCYIRAILRAQNWDCHMLRRDGGGIIEEAPADWEKRCDLLIKVSDKKPAEWI